MNTKSARLILVALAALTLWIMLRGDPAVTAQDAGSSQTCNQLIAGLADAIRECQDMNSNWACYGKVDASVFPEEYRFQALRDRRPLEVLQSIDIFDQGSVLMNLDIAGQAAPIQAILFGPVSLDAAAPGSHEFVMQIDNQNLLCSDTPPGMVIRTQSGQAGHIKLNGVDFELHSAAFVTIDGRGLMTVVNLEGNVTLTVGGVSQAIPVGQQTEIESANGQLRFTGDPTPSTYAGSALLQWLINDAAGLRNLQNTNKEETELACAGAIAFGETVADRTVNPGHECLFQFCGKAGEAVTVDMQAVDPGLDPWVDLRLPDKNLLAFNNDIDEQNDNSLLCNVQLPVTSCDYTIVARSQRNRTAGAFRLTLDRQSACTAPAPRCEVVSRFGAFLYQGPGTEFQRLQKLDPEAHMQPQRFNDDGSWIEVRVAGTTRTGWVKNDPNRVQCEIPTVPGAARSAPPHRDLLPPDDSPPVIPPKNKPSQPCSPLPGGTIPGGTIPSLGGSLALGTPTPESTIPCPAVVTPEPNSD